MRKTKFKVLPREEAIKARKELRMNAQSIGADIYTIVMQFPKYEQMVMTLLLKRQALSVVSNLEKALAIRKREDRAFFLNYANASCQSIKALCSLASNIGYITIEQNDSMAEKCRALSEGIRGLAVP